MVTIEIKNIEGKIVVPTHGSKIAAGYDIVATDDPIIVGEFIVKDDIKYYSRIDYIEYHTTLHISPSSDDNQPVHTLLQARSSIRKYNLVLANSIGLINQDYLGELIFCFKYIFQPEDLVIENGRIFGKVNYEKIYKKIDKIGQLVASKTNPIKFELVTELDKTERGEGGFGSTDKKEIVSSITNSKIITIQRKPQETSIINNKIEKTPNESGILFDKYQQLGGIPIKKKIYR